MQFTSGFTDAIYIGVHNSFCSCLAHQTIKHRIFRNAFADHRAWQIIVHIVTLYCHCKALYCHTFSLFSDHRGFFTVAAVYH